MTSEEAIQGIYMTEEQALGLAQLAIKREWRESCLLEECRNADNTANSLEDKWKHHDSEGINMVLED